MIDKELIKAMSKDERRELVNFIVDYEKSLLPTISVKVGQVLRWRHDWYPKGGGKTQRIEVGFSLDTFENVKEIMVLEYMPEYKVFKLSKVKADQVIELKDEFVDLSKAMEGWVYE